MTDKLLKDVQRLKRLAQQLAEEIEELELRIGQLQVRPEGGTRKPPPPPEGGGN